MRRADKNWGRGGILTSELSGLIKIIAILLMFCHHFLRLDWIEKENMFISILGIGNISIETIISASGQLCVALFAYISGYGLYFSMRKNNSWGKCIKRVLSLYLDFWIVLLIVFIPVFNVFGKHMSISEWIMNLIGVEYTLNKFIWYVPFYAVAVIVMLIYVRYIEQYKQLRNIAWGSLMLIWILTLFLKETLLLKYIEYIIVMLMAYLCAKHGFLDKVYSLIGLYIKGWLAKKILGIFLMGFVILGRFLIAMLTLWKIGIQFDWLFVNLFMVGVICTFNDLPEKLGKYCKFAGKLATNMWYLHAIFFGTYIKLQWIAYWPKISILIILWVYLLLIPFSWGLMKVQESVKKLLKI